MAAAETCNIKSQLYSITECSICSETFVDPRILPCVHTYCLRCVKSFGRDKQPGDQLACPLCRQEFTIPLNGFGALPKNFLMEQLKDIAAIATTSCAGCSSETDPSANVPGVLYCVDCRQSFCESCTGVHRRMSVSRGHELVRVDDGEKLRRAIAKSTTAYCGKHNNEALRQFCSDCQTVTCAKCANESHKSHRCADVDQVVDEFRRRIANDVASVTRAGVKCREILQKLEKDKTELKGKADVVQTSVRQRAEQLKVQIDREMVRLLQEVAFCSGKRTKQIDQVISEVEQHMSLADGLASYAEELIRKGTSKDILQQTSDLHDKADELSKLNAVLQSVNQLGSFDLDFHAVNLPNESTGLLVGRIHEQRADVIQSAKPTLRHVIPPDGDRAVIGVTSVGDCLFVLRSPSVAAIDVYDTVKFSPQAPVRVDGLDNNHKNALTSCAHNNCLYVGDCSRNVVLKIDVSADVTTSKWRVGLMPTGLSVNVARHLLVTCCDADKIQEYTPEGLLVREICLQAKNISLKPRHVVQLSCGLLAVCHYDPVHDVSEIDLDGRIVVSYASRLKSTTKNKFVYPRHLAVSESDCIIVADSWNHRIVVLNHSLNCVRESSVTVDGGFKEPRIIHLDASYDRLYVGEYKGNRVLVFDNVLNVNGSLK